MSDGLEGARAALTAAFQRRTLRRADDSTSSAGLSPSGGRLEAAEGRRQSRGDYTITLPGDTTVELQAGEIVTFDGETKTIGATTTPRQFRIVWAPAASNLRLSRRYGADEVT